MKLIDRAIDHVTNRVLDRMEERRPRVTVANNVVSRKWNGEIVRTVGDYKDEFTA